MQIRNMTKVRQHIEGIGYVEPGMTVTVSDGVGCQLVSVEFEEVVAGHGSRVTGQKGRKKMDSRDSTSTGSGRTDKDRTKQDHIEQAGSDQAAGGAV